MNERNGRYECGCIVSVERFILNYLLFLVYLFICVFRGICVYSIEYKWML